MTRPWASGLYRLLAARRLKKSDLAELADVRAGTISGVVNSPRPPEIPTLQRLADGLTKFDRRQQPQAPAVELWEFFVSDEQSALLHASASNRQELVRQDELLDRVMERLSPIVATVLHDVVGGQPVPAAPPSAKPAKKRTA